MSEESHVVSEALLRVMNEPLTPEERKQHNIWIRQEDIRFRTRYDDKFGTDSAQVVGRFERVLSFRDPKQTVFHIMGEHLRNHPQFGQTLNDLKIESLQAIQHSLQDYIINGILESAYDEMAYIPYRDMYVPHKPGYYKFQAKYFPTLNIQKHEVLVLTSYEMFHRIIMNKPQDEIPEALVGKIKWIEGRL